MFTTFNPQTTKLFLDPHAKKVELEGKVDIILSPSLYWVKKQALPVKYVRDAKKLAPSLFEDTLPEGNYNYSVYKEGEEFYLFAYEDKAIIDAIESSGVDMQNVHGVYFAQSELAQIDGAMKVNETQSIYVKDGVVVLVPCCWVEEKGTLSLEDITLSNHKIALQHFSHIVDTSSLNKVGAILGVLILFAFIELFITGQKVDAVVEKKEQVFAEYGLKSTMMQNKALLKKYSKTHTQQMNLRSAMGKVLSMKLQATHKLKTLEVKNKKLLVDFTGLKKGEESYIQKALKAQGMKAKGSFKNDLWHVEVSL